MTLKELQKGKTAVIKKVGGDGALRQHFLDMGVLPGAEVQVVKYAPMGDPVEILIHGYRLTLRLSEAEKIEVCPGTASKNNTAPKLKRPKQASDHPGLGESGKYHAKGDGDELPDDVMLSFALVGNQNCGKTTLFKKLSSGVFNELNIATLGIDMKTLDYEINVEENGQEVKKFIKIQLYDTAGQERYLSNTKSYFKRTNGVVLLYSIIDRNSFNNLIKWLNDVKEKLENHENNKYLAFLIGTKCDIVKEDESKRKVNVDEVTDFCVNYNITWIGELSSKINSQEDFNNIFSDIAKKLYEKIGYNIIARDHISVLSSKKTKITKKQRHHCGCK